MYLNVMYKKYCNGCNTRVTCVPNTACYVRTLEHLFQTGDIKKLYVRRMEQSFN